jgi:hypothetical protein
LAHQFLNDGGGGEQKMTDFKLQRTDEIVELLENFVVEMLRTKKVNATILKCYIDLIKLKHDMQNKEQNENPIEKTQKIMEKMLSGN